MNDKSGAPRARGVTVAVAVQELEPAVERYRAAFGLDEPLYASSPADAVDVAMFELGGSWLQLVAPTSDRSVVAKHIEANGPGLHHFGLVVDSVDASLRHIADQGLRTLDERGRPGAGDLVVGFVHPKTALGAVVELIEPPASAPDAAR